MHLPLLPPAYLDLNWHATLPALQLEVFAHPSVLQDSEQLLDALTDMQHAESRQLAHLLRDASSTSCYGITALLTTTLPRGRSSSFWETSLFLAPFLEHFLKTKCYVIATDSDLVHNRVPSALLPRAQGYAAAQRAINAYKEIARGIVGTSS